jgi:DNA-binding CsgD family transcriptional regulator/predicted HTH domain antitoxin
VEEMKKRWSEDEIVYLKENWGNARLDLIISKLERTKDSVTRKAMRLGLETQKKEDELAKKRWKQIDDEFLIKNYKVLPIEEITKCMGRTTSAIEKRVITLGVASTVRRWTMEEENLLKEKWGIVCIDTIAKRLNRSRSAVMLKAYKLSLKEQVTAGGTYLTPAEISDILGVNKRTFYTWIDKGYIKCKKFRINKKKVYQVTIEELVEFIENYQELWDSQKADMDQINSYYISYSLSGDGKLKIKEGLPNWLIQKIDKDKEGFRDHYKPWTTKEEQEVIYMASMNYRYKDICCKFGRSLESIKTKIYNINKRQYGQIASI